MDFGQLTSEEVSKIEFHMPEIRSYLRGPSDPSFRFGLPILSSDLYKGSVYPAETKKKDYLKIFASQFDALELNSTFYALPSQQTVINWVEEVRGVNPYFKFCPKILKSISHEGKLDAHFDLYAQLFKTLELFDDQLGVSLLQLGEAFTPSRLRELVNFFALWPKNFKLAVELRHPAWFKDSQILEQVLEIFAKRGIALGITDTAGRQDVLHQNITASHLLVRFVTNRNHPMDLKRLNLWAQRIGEYPSTGLKEIYFFFHEKDETMALAPLLQLHDLIADKFKIRRPVDYSQFQSEGQMNLI